MRLFEFLILVLDLIALLVLNLRLRSKPEWFRFLPSVIVGILIVHLVVEHYRWQMVPAYLLTGAFFLLTLPGMLKGTESQPGNRGLAILGGGLEVVGWVAAVALSILLPVPRLPTPPGPDAVGSVVYDWVDTSRDEAYSTDPTDKREVMVQIWYPTQPPPGAQTIPLIDHWDVAGPAIAQFLSLPSFAVDHFSLVRTHTYAETPIKTAGAPYPVVIYSHGYLGYRTASFNQMEALASSGYIVVALDHTYSAIFTVFSDGRVVLNTPAVLPPGDQQARETLEATHAADVRFVMNQLEALNSGALDKRFAGRFNLQRVGLVGISTGGGAIVWVCSLDPRCKSGIAMDGWFEPLPETVISEPLRQPFMFMQSETKMWEVDNQPRLEKLYQGVGADAYHLKFAGVLHRDFGDYPLVTPLSGLLPERGSLNGERTVQITDAYLLAYFNKYLKGQPSPLLTGPSPDYPEVQFESHSP